MARGAGFRAALEHALALDIGTRGVMGAVAISADSGRMGILGMVGGAGISGALGIGCSAWDGGLDVGFGTIGGGCIPGHGISGSAEFGAIGPQFTTRHLGQAALVGSYGVGVDSSVSAALVSIGVKFAASGVVGPVCG